MTNWIACCLDRCWVFINWKTKEINVKLVYYGAAMCGKTTNLELLHTKLDPRARGDLVSLKTREDRTIFFDFMQIEMGEIKGLKPRFNLYTVPGQTYYIASRKLVLQGADGVVFVVDSASDRLQENVAAWRNLHDNLRELGQRPETFPIILQYNKRDLPNALPVQTLREQLECDKRTEVEAVAFKGIGVFETLRPAVKLVMANLQKAL
jgi:mutual gliding-motility protein MglA